MTKRTILIGLGNCLMTDEGIGPHIVQELVRRAVIPADVEVVDLGPGGLRVIYECAPYDKAVFVDCGYMGRAPGSLARFTPAEVRTAKVRARQSLHEGDLMETLELAERLGQCPPEVVIFAIEPAIVCLGDSISDLLESRLGSYVEAIVQELEIAPQSPQVRDAPSRNPQARMTHA